MRIRTRIIGAALFVGLDLIHMLQGQTNIVQAIEQPVFSELINVKLYYTAIRFGDGLLAQIHIELITFVGRKFFK